jgi:hypothetical protein
MFDEGHFNMQISIFFTTLFLDCQKLAWLQIWTISHPPVSEMTEKALFEN